MEQRAWLLDASIYIFRAWFSMPDRWSTDDGMPLNAVYGYAGFLCDFVRRTRSAPWVAAAFDESLGTCFRHDIYAGYKARRELPDETLAFQLQACRQLTELSGISCYGGARYEADDYLASLARLARAQGLPITVLTRDKDLGQLLLNDHDQWWDFAADKTLDPVAFVERFGVPPALFADYLALVGDSVDDIPGVPGVGPKTAAVLINALGGIDNILAQLEQVSELPVRGAARLGDKLAAHRDQVVMSRALAQLADDIPGLKAPAAFIPGATEIDRVVVYLESLGLRGPLLQRWQSLSG